MTRTLILSAAMLASLAGCGDRAKSDQDASAPMTAAAAEMRPGLWAATVTGPTGTKTVETCVTAADAADARFLQGDVDDATCRVARRRVTGGTIDIDMTCGSGAEAARMRFAGSYTATSYGLETTMTMGGMRLQTRADGRHVAPTCAPRR